MSRRTLAYAEVMRVGKFASVNPFVASNTALLCQATPHIYIQKIPTAAVTEKKISLSVICWLACHCQRPVINPVSQSSGKRKADPRERKRACGVCVSHGVIWRTLSSLPRLEMNYRVGESRERADACWECSAVATPW